MCSGLVDRLKRILIRLQTPYQPPDVRVTIEEVDDNFIRARLAKLPNWREDRRLLLDNRYYTVSLEDFKRIIAWDKTNRHPYIVDRFDCDDYSLYFKANAAWYFGVNAVALVIDYSGGHAYNLLFPLDLDNPIIYEPENDNLIEIEKRDTRFYRLNNYYVLL